MTTILYSGQVGFKMISKLATQEENRSFKIKMNEPVSSKHLNYTNEKPAEHNIETEYMLNLRTDVHICISSSPCLF